MHRRSNHGTPGPRSALGANGCRSVLCLLLVIACAALAPAAEAATRAEKEAHTLYMKARDLFKDGRFEDAVTVLDKAYTLFPKPIILLKKAECYEKLDKPEEALAAYDLAISQEPKADMRAKIETSRKAVQAVLSRPIELSVVSNVPVTEITIDGKAAGATPVRVDVPRGPHTIVATKEGYTTEEQKIFLRGTRPHVATLELRERLGKVIVRTDRANLVNHTLSIDEVPIELDERERRNSASDPHLVRIGSHVLACGFPGYRTYFAPFEVVEGSPVEVSCNFAEFDTEPLKDYTWAWVTLSGAIASTGTGVFLVVSYFNDRQQAEDQGLGISTSKDDFGIVFLSVGAALAGTSIYLFVDPPGADEETSAVDRVTPFHMSLVPLPDGGAMFGAGGAF